MSNSKQRKVEQARKLEAVLCDLFPYAFSSNQPLKIGIQEDVLAATKGAITPAELRLALWFHVGNFAYLRACVEGAARIDLFGELAGRVSADEAAFAAAQLAQRKAALKARKPARSVKELREKGRCALRVHGCANLRSTMTDKAVPVALPNPINKRVTLSDLRAAAQARKAGAL